MEVRWLRSFLVLLRHQHFGKAALELGLSQPALTLQMQSLEDALKTPLFVRRPGSKYPVRPVQITDAGEELALRAARIVNEVDAAKFSVEALGVVPTGTVHLAITAHYREPVAAAVAALPKNWRHIPVVVDEGKNVVQIERGVRDGTIHLGVVTARFDNLYTLTSETVTSEKLGDAPLQLIVNRKHRLATVPRIRDIRRLARERFVLPTSPSLERIVLAPIFQDAFVPTIVVETSAADSALAHVRANPSLVTILPVPKHIDRRDLAFLDFPQPTAWPTSTYILWRGTGPRTAAARRVAATIISHFQKGTAVRSSASMHRS